MGRKRRLRRPHVAKVPVVGDKALPGRPRKDGLPPIQRKVLLTPEDKALLANKALLARIGHLAGVEGLPPKLIAVRIRHDYPESGAQTEDFEVNGRFYEAALLGMAIAAGEVGANLHDRAKNPTGKGFEALFFMKCRADWAETAAGRKKTKDADEDDMVAGIDVTVTE